MLVLSVSVVFKLLGFLTMVSNTEYRHRLGISHRWLTAAQSWWPSALLQSAGQYQEDSESLNPDMDFGVFSPLHVIKKTNEGPFTAAVLSEKKPWSRNLINDIYYLYKLYEPPPGPAPPLAPITRVMYLCQPSISNVHFLSWPQYIYYNKFIISFVCFVLTLKHWSDVSIMLL